uniref:Uncharacterized protein n=1 Tax=Rhizophora mucronata TaxID=61149 RepID=A0A2P2P5C5_RHIMU
MENINRIRKQEEKKEMHFRQSSYRLLRKLLIHMAT